jgi:hypothetical protein
MGWPGSQADRADRLTGQTGLPNLLQACLLCFVLATSALVLLKWMFHELICVQQSTFLRYICSKHNSITNTTLSINDTQHNATGHYARIILLGVAFLLLCKVQLSWMFFCWVSLCRVSWRRFCDTVWTVKSETSKLFQGLYCKTFHTVLTYNVGQ